MTRFLILAFLALVTVSTSALAAPGDIFGNPNSHHFGLGDGHSGNRHHGH